MAPAARFPKAQPYAAPSVADDSRKCPYCAEMIRVEAIKCRHCGSDIARLQIAPAPMIAVRKRSG